MEKTSLNERVRWVLFFMCILAVFHTSALGDNDPNNPYENYEPEGFLQAMAATASAGINLPFDPNDYNFLIYESPSSENSIRDAMAKLGISYTVCDSTHPVTTALLNSHDILIVGWESGSSTTNKDGLVTSAIEDGITGRVILSGHDSDYHTVHVEEEDAATTFFIQEIDYILKGGGTGLLVCADPPNNFDWLPESWGITANSESGTEITSFTQDGLDSGIYDNLTLELMSDWSTTYHNAFTAWGDAFKVFELGEANNSEIGYDVVTIAAPINAMGFDLWKYDDVADGDCRDIDEGIEYTIEWHNTTEQTFYDSYLKDIFPAGVSYPVTYSIDPNTLEIISSDPGYHENDHTYIYPVGTLYPDDSGLLELDVVVNDSAEPGCYLHNKIELWATTVDPNGLNPIERLIATNYEDTLACCWDTNGILYVDKNATGKNTGVSWADAYTDLQDALTRARTTQCTVDYVIYVAQENYSPGTFEGYSFNIPIGVAVYGGFPTGGCDFSLRNPKKYKTTLTGYIDETTRNTSVVVMGNETLLDGFTITNAGFEGQCIYGSGADFSLVNSTIADSWGYGIRAIDGNVNLNWCTVQNNSYDGIWHSGSGFALNVENCWFKKQGQTGILSDMSTPVLKNSVVTESDLSKFGNAGVRMINPSNQPIFANCTLSHNKSVAVSQVGGAMPSLVNSIVYHNNSGGRQLSASLNPDVMAQYCCIADCNEVNNNINVDPEFAYFDPNNVRIMAGSPCHDSGLTVLDHYTQFDMDKRDRVLGNAVDRGAYEIECEDTSNSFDRNADGRVNFQEYADFSRFWMAHDPNDPALNDPNHIDYEYLTDPNSPGYVTASSIAAWYPDGHSYNFSTIGESQYAIDLADLLYWTEESPWLWCACWLTETELLEMTSGGEMLLMGDGFVIPAEAEIQSYSAMGIDTTVAQQKSVQEQMFDLATAIVFLEQIWLEDPQIQQEIDTQVWQEFMNAVYQNLLDLQTEAVQIK
jgi:hypothetical protein